MVYNTITTRHIVAKVFRDFNIQEGDVRESDIKEWVGEGLRKIGSIKTLNIKVTGKEGEPLLSVDNYQTKLPVDLYRLIGVAFSTNIDGPFIPLRYGTGNFDHRGTVNSETTNEILPGDNAIITTAMNLYSLSYSEAVTYLNSNPNTEQYIRTLLTEKKLPTVQQQTNPTTDFTYVINGSYIKLNCKEGFLMMAYAALPIDIDGYPLIPDDEMFSEALYYYVLTKLLFPDWVEGRVRDGVYNSIRNSWSFYRKAAYAASMLPNADGLESLKNQALKLYPEINEFKNFFSTTGEEQILYNHNQVYGYSGRYR